MELTHFPPAAPIWAKPRGLYRWMLLLMGAAAAGVAAIRPAPRPVLTPVQKDVQVSITYPGTIHSGRAVGVGAAIDGGVKRVAVRPGQFVRAGDLLFTLDPAPLQAEARDLEQQIREMEAELGALNTHDAAPEFRQAVRQLEAATRRWIVRERRGEGTDADLQNYRQAVQKYRRERQQIWDGQAELRNSIQAARQDLAALYAQVPRFKRVSPGDGLVSAIYVQPGQQVKAGAPLLRLEDASRISVRVLVGERDGARVRPGQRAWIQVKRKGFPARVTRVTPGIDDHLWQSWVTLQPAGTPRPFQNGQRVSVRVVTAHYPKAIVLPRHAVRDWRTGSVVYVARGGRVEERLVKAVRVDSGEMAILDGLQPAETVVLKG